MAGDWLKIEKDTPEKPEIFGIAQILGISHGDAFLLCFKFWRWADSHMSDGRSSMTTNVAIDGLLGVSGASGALAQVGWLSFEGDNVAVVPNWGRHLSQSSKRRALKARTMQKYRANCGHDVDTDVDEDVDGSVSTPLLFSISNNTHVSKEVKHTKINRCIRPTLNEITDYCKERGNAVDPQAFFDFYEANGWVQGRQGKPIKDWRAAVRTWEHTQALPIGKAAKPQREIPQLA